MKARLLILIAVAAGMAIYWAGVTASPPTQEEESVEAWTPLSKIERERLEATQQLLQERELPGEEPSQDPEFSIEISVDPTDGKNRLYYTITEAHDFYVETFRLRFWYLTERKMVYEDSDLRVPVFLNDYLRAKDTLSGCIEIVPAELARVGGHIGTADDWAVEILSYGRARAVDPDPLPPLVTVATCD